MSAYTSHRACVRRGGHSIDLPRSCDNILGRSEDAVWRLPNECGRCSVALKRSPPIAHIYSVDPNAPLTCPRFGCWDVCAHD